jgi:hypothetical protein
MNDRIVFQADRVRVMERITDNSYKVEFFTGEYEQENVVKLMALPKDVVLKISVEVEE